MPPKLTTRFTRVPPEVAADWTEAEFTRHVLGLARAGGWLAYHPRAARTGKGWRTAMAGTPGFVDLTLARAGEVLFAELKVGAGVRTAEQLGWAAALPAAAYRLWTPADLREIERVLLGEPGGGR